MDAVAIIKSKNNSINSVNVQYTGWSFKYPYASNTKATLYFCCIVKKIVMQQVQAKYVLMLLCEVLSGWLWMVGLWSLTHLSPGTAGDRTDKADSAGDSLTQTYTSHKKHIINVDSLPTQLHSHWSAAGWGPAFKENIWGQWITFISLPNPFCTLKQREV